VNGKRRTASAVGSGPSRVHRLSKERAVGQTARFSRLDVNQRWQAVHEITDDAIEIVGARLCETLSDQLDPKPGRRIIRRVPVVLKTLGECEPLCNNLRRSLDLTRRAILVSYSLGGLTLSNARAIFPEALL